MDMFKSVGLTQKFLAIFVIISLLQGFLIARVTWAPFEERIKQHVFTENLEMASRIANDIERMFTEKINILSIMVENEAIKSMDEKRQQRVLSSMANNMNEVQLGVLSDALGQQIARWDQKPADPTINYSDRTYFKQVMSTGDLAISDVLRARSTNKLGVVVAMPVKSDEGNIIAVLIVNIELEKLIETIVATGIGTSERSYVVNSKQEIVISPERGLMEQPIKTNDILPIVAVAAGKSGSIEYIDEGRRILASYVPVNSAQWGVVVEQSYSHATAGIAAIRQNAMLIVVLLALLSAAIGSFMAIGIVHPIKRITEASSRLAGGDMSVRLLSGPSGELGLLIASFNQMATQLSRRQDELEEMVTQRTHELSCLNEELERIATIDGLTGLANRRYLDSVLVKEWKRALRDGTVISIMMIDVDFFKAYNDNFGHQVGDDALKSIARGMEQAVFHSTDLVARYGGEEFMFVLPGTDIEGALTVARRLETLIFEANISHPTSKVSDRLTVSIGIASCVPNPVDSLEGFIISSDQALYKAKTQGRNQIVY